MQELRTDLLTGETVILATGRALRPDTFRVHTQPLPAAVASCPFCPGNEHETPPEVMRIGPGPAETPGWRVRVVPNKYPLVGDGVAGAHEVVILSPAHDKSVGELAAPAMGDAFLALRDRAAFHLDRGLAHAQPFVNHGKAAGASIEHPHAQLVALDFVPDRVAARTQRFAAAGDLVQADMNASSLVADGDVSVWCPYGSGTPYVVRVALRDAGPRFDRATDDEACAVADALHDTVARLQRLLGDLAYNVVIETAPRDLTSEFHWWVDVIPRLTVAAGFELGTGAWANIVAPDAAAEALRDVDVRERVMNIRVAIDIDAPPAVVWAAVEAIENHVDWMADAEAIRFTSDERRGVGTTFDCETKVGPLRLVDRIRVTEWETARVMGIEHRGLVTGRGRFTLDPIDAEGTRFTWTETLTFPVKMGGAVGAIAAKPVLTQIWRRNLRRLKTIVEDRNE